MHNVKKRTNVQSEDTQCNQTNKQNPTFLDPSFHYHIDDDWKPNFDHFYLGFHTEKV